jgi:hypothetical protein
MNSPTVSKTNNDTNDIKNTISNSKPITYINKIKSVILEKNMIVFLIAIAILQISSKLIVMYIPTLEIFQVPLVPGLFSYLVGELTEYQYIVGAIISALVAYLLFIFLTSKIKTPIYKYLFNSIVAFIVAVIMILFSAFSASSIGYTFMAGMSIPSLKFGYVYSYVIGIILSVLLCKLLLYIKHRILKVSSVDPL